MESYEPDASADYHEHENPYVSFVLSGGYIEEYGSLTFECPEGTLTYHPAGDAHRNRFFRSGAVEVWIGLSHAAWPEADSIRFDGHGVEAIQFGLRLLKAYRQGNELEPLVKEELCWESLALFQPDPHRDNGAWLGSVREYLDGHWAVPFSLIDLSQVAQRHPSHLCRAFRLRVGKSIGEYVRTLRVWHAKRMIAGTDGSIGKIAQECGFADQSHLIRNFRTEFGQTPREFRMSLSLNDPCK